MTAFRVMTVEAVTEALIDYRGRTPPKTSSGVRLVTAKVIKDGQILPEPAEFISPDFYDEWMRRGLPRDLDVLITTEAPLGEVALLRLGAPVALAQRVILLRANPAILEPRYLFHAMRSDFVQAGLRARSSGTTVLGIKQSELRQVCVPVPTLTAQRRIAGILSAYDDLIENCERRIRVLDEMARALYREWFVDFRYPDNESVPLVDSDLGLVPKGWRPTTIGTLAGFLSRGISPTYDVNGPSLVINQKCIRDKRLDLAPARRQSKAIPPDRHVRPGDVLINSTGVGTLGRVAQVENDLGLCTVDSHVTIVRAGEGVDATYLGAALLELQPTFERSGVGATGQTELSRSAVGEVEVIAPPAAIQARFGAVVAPLRTLALRAQHQTKNLRATRDLLLPRLLSGELAVGEGE